MYASEICAKGIFVTFPWWLENVKSRSKVTLFSNERHSEIWFPKTRAITFFWSKLSKLHKKDPILLVATTFSLKQGETRTSHGPIPHPLSTRFMVGAKVIELTFLPRWRRIDYINKLFCIIIINENNETMNLQCMDIRQWLEGTGLNNLNGICQQISAK